MKKNRVDRVIAVVLACSVLLSTFGAFPGVVYAAKFNIGDTVEVTTNLNVRTGPGTAYLEITDSDYHDYAPAGTKGRVLDGPSNADGYVWWKIDFGPGLYSGWSVEGGLEKVNQPPFPPTPLSPGSSLSPGSTIDNLTPTFQWSGVSDADYYALAISKYPYGSVNIVYNPQQLTGTSHIVPAGRLEYGEKYCWNMQAHNSAGWSDISSTLYFQTVPPSLPDLVVTEIQVDPSPPISSGSTTIGITIRNQGDADAAETFFLEFYFDGTYKGHVYVDGLAAGRSRTSEWRAETWPSDTNPHTVKGIVDPDDVVSESNEGNNERSKPFTAEENLLPTVDHSPSSFSFTATEGGSNPSSKALSIRNSGGGTLSWSVSDDAAWLSLSPTSGASAGETDSVAVSVSISGMSAGSYTATITISDQKASNTPQAVPVSLIIEPPTTISARIDSYSPSSKVEVDPGQSFTISVTFTNTGNTAWDFLAGASIWDSNGNEVVDDWSGAIRVQPGQQGSYSWTHTLSTPGEYTLQFGVWKDQSTLLNAKPSPPQNLIKVKQPTTISDSDSVNIENVPYIHQTYDTAEDFDGRWACGAASTVMVTAYYGKLDEHPITCPKPVTHTNDYSYYVSNQYTNNYGNTYSQTALCRNGEYAPGAFGYIHYPDGAASGKNAVEYLNQHDLDAWVIINPTEAQVKTELDAGFPVIASTKLTPLGHWVVIKGYTDAGYYVVNDPFGDYPYDDQEIAGWGEFEGADVLYTWSDMRVDEKYAVFVHSKSAIISTPVPNDIFTDETQAHGELSSGISAMVADSSGIRGSLVVRSYVNAWLSLSATAKDGAIVGSDDISVSFGVIPPGGTATYHGDFSQVDQSIDITARYDFDAWLWNTADAVLSLIPGSSALGGGGLVETLNALKGLDAIQKAASELQTIRYDGWASAPGHALSAANKLRELVTNEQQVAALQTILARVGLNVSYDSLKNLLTLTQIYDQLVRIGHTLVFFIVAPDGATVTFKAQYLESAHNPPPPPPPPSVGEGAPNPQLFIDCYNQNGGATILGYPVNKAHRWGNGYIQDFRGGEGHEGAIMQPDGANQAYAVYGSIWSKYLALGGAEGQLGYPTTDETEGPTSSITSARCRYNKFGDGAIAHRKATGTYEAKTVFLGWGVFIKWEEPGYGNSALGLPISDERETPQSGAEGFDTRGIICDFEGGHIYWHHRDTGAYADQCFETHGAIDTLYTQMGGTASWLGFPISDEYENDSGYAQSDFETGYITTTDGITYQAFPYNKAPTLSWTGEVNYDNDGLDPESGNSATNFVYRIKYTDQDGDAPNFVRVHILKGGSDITNSPFTMSKVSGTYESGAIYSYTKSGMSKGADYSYYFEAQDIHSNDAIHTPELDAPHVSTNQPPTAYIDSITPNPATQGEDTVHFEGHGTDSDSDGIVAHNWRSRIDGQLNTFGSFDKPASELAAGTHTIYFKIQDDEGLWSSEVTEVLTINPSSSGPEIAYSPGSFSFEASEAGSNPSDKTLIIWNAGGGILNWEVNDEAGWLSLVPTSGSSTGEEDCVAVSVDISGLGADTYHATITISSSEATNTPQTVPVSLTLVLSEEPSAHTNADPGGPYAASEGAPVLIDGGGSTDPDGDIVLYEWDWNGDGTYDETTITGTTTHTWIDDYSGVIWLRVTDNHGAQHEASTSIQIENVAPTVEAGDTITVNLGEEAVFQGSYTDPGEDSHTITWDFEDEETASDTLTPNHIYDNPGQYTATLTVTDDDGGEATDTVNVNVLAPTTLELGLLPSCSIGSPLEIDGELYTPGSLIPDAQVLIEYRFTAGNTWNEITMTPTDQEGKYQATWIPQATGSYIIRAKYSGEPSMFLREASHQTSLSVTPGEANSVFSVVSNSIITDLAFDSTRETLSFTISGDAGTSSHTHIVIAKTLIPDITGLKIHVDGDEVDYTYTSDESRWTLTFEYSHSSHTVVLSIQPTINQPPVAQTQQTIEGTQNSPLTFTASGSYDPDGSITKYAWDFGDSNPRSDVTTTHTYTTTGDYTAALTVTDDQGATDTATCKVTIKAAASGSYGVPPSPPSSPDVTAEDIEKMDSTTAAKVIKEMDSKKAAEILPKVSTEKRLKILEQLETETILNIINEMSKEDASLILTGLSSVKTSEVLCLSSPERAGEILNVMDITDSAQVILELDIESGSKIIEEMAHDDLTEAARRVEEAVKEKIKDAPQETQREALKKLAETLEHVDVDSLVDLFVEIAQLPETPETVATIFEAMDITKLNTIIDAWIDKEHYDELSTVMSYLTNDTLQVIYCNLSMATRETLHPYLDEATINALPREQLPLPDPMILDVSIRKETYHKYTIETTIQNNGNKESGELKLGYTINGTLFKRATFASLEQQKQDTSEIIWVPEKEGEYSILISLTSASEEMYNENNQYHTTRQIRFPDLQIEILSVPEEVIKNEECCIKVKVSNTGPDDIVEGFKVALLVQNQVITDEVAGLKANEEKTSSLRYTPSQAGQTIISAEIDYDDSILESDETNNVNQTTLEVKRYSKQTVYLTGMIAASIIVLLVVGLLIRRK